MDCSTIRGLFESYSKNGAEKALGKDIQRHIQSCEMCRGKYTALLDDGNSDREIIPDPAEIKGLNPQVDDPADQFPDIADPVEFKDGPITFLLILDGREEEIKMVEPQIDYPLPEGGRLVVRQKGVRLTDVVFKYNSENDRPYELLFNIREGVSYSKPHVRKYGIAEISSRGTDDVYTEEIIEKGGVKTWIEMKQGKARIYLQYKPQSG